MLDRREKDLVIEAKAGNAKSFGRLVERYQNLVTSLAFSKTGDLQRSEDIAQQAFLIAWQKRGELRDPEKFGGWIRAITRNLVLNSNRKTNRLDRSAQSLAPQHEPTTSSKHDESSVTEEQQKLLWDSIKNIPDSYREPLILFYRQDQSIQQVADQLELSVDAVKQRLSRGRAMLKKEVEQHVEELLGTTKPSSSFAASILTLIPTVTTAAAPSIIKTGSALGAKSVLGKLGLLGTGSIMGPLAGILGGLIGVTCAWYGTNAAANQATSEEEKSQLWRFFYSILALTFLTTAVSVFVSFTPLDDASRLGSVLLISSVYSVILAVLVISFVIRQRRLHQTHGKPDYIKNEYRYSPTSTLAFRWGALGTTIGCWIWVFVLLSTKQAWLANLIAVPFMLGQVAWLFSTVDSNVTAYDQCRFQAKNLMLSGMLTGSLFIGLGLLFLTHEFGASTIWGIGLSVAVLMWLLAGLIWSVGGKIEQAMHVTELKPPQ